MADTLVHIVMEGEHLHEIAARYGTKVESIWNLPQNQRLRDLGRTPDLLAPLDVLYVPFLKREYLPVKIGQKNVFTATIPTVDVVFRVVGRDGEGMANEPYEVVDLKVNGVTDSEGTVRLENVPISLKEVPVRFPQRNATILAAVGYLDPVSLPSGKAQRLAHLGYLPLGSVNVAEYRLSLALAEFISKVAPGAKTDADIEQALVAAHGS